nr:hypothetical protein [Tanacetum cinerariifolium]
MPRLSGISSSAYPECPPSLHRCPGCPALATAASSVTLVLTPSRVGGDAAGSGMGRVGGDAGSGGDGICGNEDDNGVSGDVSEAAAGSGYSSAENISSSGGIYYGYTGSST